MDEYRKDIQHKPDSEYAWVEMGPIPDQPDWHMRLYAHQAYPFPTNAAALLFAATHRGIHPGRSVVVRMKEE